LNYTRHTDTDPRLSVSFGPLATLLLTPWALAGLGSAQEPRLAPRYLLEPKVPPPPH